MTAQGHGRIVLLSSVSGLLAHAKHAPYAASKEGLNQMMRVMAHEWAGAGVTVNAVAPGYVETHLTTTYLERPGVRDDLTGMVPAGRTGRPGRDRRPGAVPVLLPSRLRHRTRPVRRRRPHPDLNRSPP